MIEYVTRAWNPITGCLHTMAQCPTADKCWARSIARRFPQVAGGDFNPRYHPKRLNDPLKWRKPYTVAVCFMGDLLSSGVQEEWLKAILGVVYESAATSRYDGSFLGPQHRFLFLTKAPEQLACYNPWPPNAWVGITITGAETGLRQLEMITALRAVKGGHRWLSYEPMLGRLGVALDEMEWLVLGAQTGKGAMKPETWWNNDAVERARCCSIPIWQKENLIAVLNLQQPEQEVPW